ncbi:sulfate adenylyltransferase subunit CysN [Oryzomicrobium sp.]|uniref:sulfate adenylyltransferase subunit CysN n=1 Tax=Oryzomicrobium sp. TaxID=1911578 RepID=UPI002FE17812
MVRPQKTSSAPLQQATSQVPKDATIHDWMTQQAQQDLLRFITCGSVDDGKSTLIGRLLWESQQVFDDQLTALQADSRRHGTQGQDIDFALLVDGLAAEREQGITIDVAYRFFATPRRKFIVADTPGHEQYTRNMVTGASTADVAVLLIDARQGVLTQTRRHAYLVSLVGIKQVVLAVNKMDLVGYKPEVFDTIVAEFHTLAQPLGFTGITPIPLSALKGDNITERSRHTAWYQGPTLVGCLETLHIDQPSHSKAVFPVQWVNRPNASFRGFSGTLAAGQLAAGDALRITASGQTATLARIVTADGDLNTAYAGDAITLVLDREVDASRGDVMALADKPLEMTDQFEATLVWMHDEPGHMGRAYELKLANQWASASLTSLKYRVDVNTQAHESCKQLALNDIAVANLALSKPLVFAPYGDNRTLGGFILVDKFTHATVAVGMIRHNLRRAQNVHRQALSITREDRERLNGHKGKVIWFTGLSGSGKSTLANTLEKELHTQGKRTYILDGDNIRQGLNKDLGFTDADRVENIRRVAEMAKLMMDAGLIVMTAFISPFRAEREMARELIGPENFVEVFVDTPLEVCEQRDPKGLYKKARSGQLPNMTGINSPYEPPLSPSCVLVHGGQDMEVAISLLTNLLHP